MAGKKSKTEKEYRYKIDSEGINRRYPGAQWECPHCKEWNPAKHTQCNSCKKGIARAADFSDTPREKTAKEDESIIEYKNENSPMHLAMAARYQPEKMGHEISVEAKFEDKYTMNLPIWVAKNRVKDKLLKVRSGHDLTKIREVYEVAGETLSRAEVMGKIVEGIASGIPLVALLKSDPGWPDPLDVRVWRRRYPKFDEDLKEAEKVFGDILYEQGRIQWQDALLVVVRALLAGLLALLGDTAAGNPVGQLLAQLHPASLLAGSVLAVPLALRKRSVSSSSMPVRRRSAKASKSTSE